MRWACPGALATTMAVLVSLSTLVACNRTPPAPRKVAPEELRSIAPANADDINQFANRLEKLVLRGDLTSIEQLWLDEKDLAGCELAKMDTTVDEMATFAQARLREFKEQSEETLAEPMRSGKMLNNNRWMQEQPKYMQGTLTGQTCAAHAFGRVNVVLAPRGGEVDVVEHRFNALQIGGRWKLFGYHPQVREDCSDPATAKEFGCKKLARQQGPG